MSKDQDNFKIINLWVERNLTQETLDGSLSKAFEVDGIIDQLTECILSGRNPIITGESGIGKTSIIHELVQRIESGSTLGELKGQQVLQLSLRRRASGLKQPSGQMRPEMQKLVTALLDPDCNIIPYFRDLHLAHVFNLEPQLQLLSFQLQVPILAEGERKTIQSMLEETPELSQQFLTITIEEPSLTTAHRILELWSEEQQKQSRMNFSLDALEEALYLSHRFLARDRLPRKALDLLTHAGSLAEDGRTITGTNVIERFCSHHRVPNLLIDPALPLELQDLEDRFKSAVLGQQEAIHAIVQMVSMIKSGLSDMRRPFGTFLFVGPTGVGKTHLAQFLAEVLFSSRDRIVRLNMADYPLERHAQSLFGDPDDHRPAQIRGLLTRRISGQPFAVLLLDEFEKAHPKVHDRFLQLIDEGSFINGAAETVSCRSMIIIMTSNTGAEVYRGQTIGFSPTGDLTAMDREVDRRLSETFRFEFLNRLDVAIRMRKRFAGPILHLAELIEENTPTPADLSTALEQAANSFRQWEDCLAEEGQAEVWMALSTSDPLKSAGRWIRKLANMELAWSRQLGLTASVAAYSIAEDELNRAVLEIEGPGAEIYLSMEHGIHRLHFPRRKDSRIRVEVLPNSSSKDNSQVDIRPTKHRRGEFNMELRCRGRVEIENRGYIVELFAENKSVLSRLLPDLARAWSNQPAQVDVSRIYGRDGVIHDPRTGVTSNRIKEVWKGRLDEFLEGWRRMKG
jgi:hypothetical protein